MKRHEQREKAMITVYQYLLVNRDLEELEKDTFGEEEIDPYIQKLMETSIGNIERYSGYINQVLKGWTFDRLGCIEQAILLNGCAEFDMKETEAAVIIDESVRLAKKYCDSDTYKLINSVLDII